MLIIVAIIFIIIGILVKYAKMHFLMAGYNTMSKKDQKQYDIEGIASVFRNAMFIMALIMLLGYALTKWFGTSNLDTYILLGALAIGLPYILIASNSSKYKMDQD